MTLSKWQALGNDYLLVERAELPEPLTPDRVRHLCDYHYGVGSDGLLEVVQVKGTVRGKMRVAAGLNESEIVPKAMAEPAVALHLNGRRVVKWIVVPDKLVNVVVA